MNLSGKRLGFGPGPDGATQVQLSGGRSARRLNKNQVYLVCGDCRDDVLIQRRDGQPLSAADISEALSTWAHTCGEPA